MKQSFNYFNKSTSRLSKGGAVAIGIRIPDIAYLLSPELIKGVFDFLVKKNYHLHLYNSDNDPKKEE